MWPSRATTALLLMMLALGSGCGDRPPRVPTGEPLSVVRASADLTERAGLVTVFVDSPGESVNAQVDLANGAGPVDIRERARAALDIARRATAADAYGGQQVRGVSTMRYDVTPRGGGHVAIWVDVAGRARRVQFPDGPLSASPPPTQPNGLAALVTIDFVFPQPQVPTGEPDL